MSLVWPWRPWLAWLCLVITDTTSFWGRGGVFMGWVLVGCVNFLCAVSYMNVTHYLFQGSRIVGSTPTASWGVQARRRSICRCYLRTSICSLHIWYGYLFKLWISTHRHRLLSFSPPAWYRSIRQHYSTSGKLYLCTHGIQQRLLGKPGRQLSTWRIQTVPFQVPINERSSHRKMWRSPYIEVHPPTLHCPILMWSQHSSHQQMRQGHPCHLPSCSRYRIWRHHPRDSYVKQQPRLCWLVQVHYYQIHKRYFPPQQRCPGVSTTISQVYRCPYQQKNKPLQDLRQRTQKRIIFQSSQRLIYNVYQVFIPLSYQIRSYNRQGIHGN